MGPEENSYTLLQMKEHCSKTQEIMRGYVDDRVNRSLSDIIIPLKDSLDALRGEVRAIRSQFQEDKGIHNLSIQTRLTILEEDMNKRRRASLMIRTAIWGAVAMNAITVAWNFYQAFTAH